MKKISDKFGLISDRKFVKRKYILIFIMNILSSFSLTPAIFIPEDASGLLYLAVILFMIIFATIGIILNISISPRRKKYEENKLYHSSRSTELRFYFPFFSNKFATVIDILLILCLAFSFIIMSLELSDVISFIFCIVTILMIELHVTLNSKNFDFYIHFRNIEK